ncbi:putative SOS response-associated peptidase YedK [Sporotomaculum syntrophicum]|uniref:Abasic site processing protein n=1 Tax=Sporotomaculum syntrophicum TaxID=182264 RepID=A0A9D2WR09_9FIRM|nr:SOS response-associated peptidase [Sporotomaculum syntrophicum]KAF1085503.1 putative SOS response-associated peptidase YedK [Sporotomaculum syntrophicum]
MCGRFTLTVELSSIIKVFQAQIDNAGFAYGKRYNIAPGQNILAITHTEETREISCMRWGLIPHWANDISIANKLINARAETVDRKPSFKPSFLNRRCLIPADGFYEWQKKAGGKIPHRITLPGREVFAFAGIWAKWRSPQGRDIHSCSIITCEANAQMKDIHNRMPVILTEERDYHTWLTSDNTTALKELMQPFDGPIMVYPVTRQVNSPGNDFPSLIDEQIIN